MIGYENWKKILRDQSFPIALCNLNAFDKNLDQFQKMLEGTHSPKIRLATKSIRVPELMRRVLARGGPFQGLMCFSAREALFLSTEGFDDFLVAYPTVQKADLEALRTLHGQGKKIRLIVDSLDAVKMLSDFLGDLSRPFEVVLEVDLSLRGWDGLLHLGVRRSPVRSVQHVLEFYKGLNSFPSIRCVGLMGYEALVAGMRDRNPFQPFLNPLVWILRRISAKAAQKKRKEISDALSLAGISYEIFNGGGSGSFNWSVRESVLTEVTIGSGLMGSHLFDYYSNIQFQAAAFFALQAVRSSDEGMVTCQGGGYIASGETGEETLPRPASPPGCELVSKEGCGEVQTPIRLPAGVTVRLGDPVIFRHAKAGELAERFNEYFLIQDGKIVSSAKTYRGFGECYF